MLGVVEGDDSVSLEAIALSLQAKSLLLVIDNCEHLLPAAATLVEALLGKCGGLYVLATSREPLRIEGEAVYDLDPLATPPLDSAEASSASEFSAVQLFVDRATAARSTFVLDQTNVRSRSQRLHATRGPSPCHRARCGMPSLDDGERDREAAHA